MILIQYRVKDIKKTEKGFRALVEFDFDASDSAILGTDYKERLVQFLNMGKLEYWKEDTAE